MDLVEAIDDRLEAFGVSALGWMTENSGFSREVWNGGCTSTGVGDSAWIDACPRWELRLFTVQNARLGLR